MTLRQKLQNAERAAESDARIYMSRIEDLENRLYNVKDELDEYKFLWRNAVDNPSYQVRTELEVIPVEDFVRQAIQEVK